MNEPPTGIADERRACVAHERDAGPLPKTIEKLGKALVLVVLVERYYARFNPDSR